MKHAIEIQEKRKASQEAKDRVDKYMYEASSLRKSLRAKDNEINSSASALKKAG